MAKNTDLEYNNLLNNLKKGETSPFYFLVGEEEYFIDKLIDWLENNIIDDSERDFNQYVYYGTDVEIDTVLATCRQYPFGSPRQLVLLKELQGMKGTGYIEKLDLYLKNPVQTTILAVSYKGEVPATLSKLLKKHEKNGIVFRSPLIRSYEIDKYIKGYCDSKKIKIDDKSLSLLSEYVGTSLKKIVEEIDRLEISEKRKIDRITPELIEKYIGISKDYNLYELNSALVARDYLKSLKIINYFRANSTKNPPQVIIPVLFSLFQRIAIAHSLPSKTDESFSSALGNLSYPALKELKSALKSYSLAAAVRIIALIREYDAKTKGIGSSQNSFDLLQELIFKIITTR